MAKKPPMKMIAYEYLKEMILTEQITEKTEISENAIAETLGISRTPVREAVVMLEADGYLKIYPNKGPRVAEINIEDMLCINQIREPLEGMAARLACGMADKNELLVLEEKFFTLTDLEEPELKEKSFMYGRELHDLILQSTKNRRMIRIIETMTAQMQRIMIVSRADADRALITYHQHLSIIRDILDNQPDKAEKDMREHIASVSESAVRIICRRYR